MWGIPKGTLKFYLGVYFICLSCGIVYIKFSQYQKIDDINAHLPENVRYDGKIYHATYVMTKKD